MRAHLIQPRPVLLHKLHVGVRLPGEQPPAPWLHVEGCLPEVLRRLPRDSRQDAERLEDLSLRMAEFNSEWLHVLGEVPGHPLIQPILTRWLLLLRPYTPAPHAAEGSDDLSGPYRKAIQQVAAVLDIPAPPVKVGSHEAKLSVDFDGHHLICHPLVQKLRTPEFRFLVLRALYHHYQRHNELWRLTRAWTPDARRSVLRLFGEWNLRHGKPIVREHVIQGNANCDRLVPLSQWLNRFYESYPRESVHDLRELLVRPRPFDKLLRAQANLYACSGTGLVAASYAIARTAVPVEQWEELDAKGLDFVQQAGASEEIQRLWAGVWEQDNEASN